MRYCRGRHSEPSLYTVLLILSLQSKVVQKISINQGVQNTLDPDQWYGGSSKLNERAQFLESLYWFKHQSANQSNEEIEFLSILLLARQNNVNGHKILEGLPGRKRPGFAMDIIWNAEDRKDKLINSLQNPKIKTKPTVQDIDQAENDSRYAIESREWYFKHRLLPQDSYF